MVVGVCQVLQPSSTSPMSDVRPAENLIVVVVDGFRWQELFEGADHELLGSIDGPAGEINRLLYDAPTSQERRALLLPFFWKVISRQGQLIGNRGFGSRVNTTNLYQLSYPGYNEMFTGNADILISSNKKQRNPHANVFEQLNSLDGFRGRVVAFTSWDVFPYILNEHRNGLLVNSGYEPTNDTSSAELRLLDQLQQRTMRGRAGTRYDELTFVAAKEYMAVHHPRVVLLGLGETDEYAHQGRYDLYLHHANKTDRMLAELWHWIQQTPGYANRTNLLITTDHGRGRRDKNWSSHGSFIAGSSETWIALMGPGVSPRGEHQRSEQYYQAGIAQLITALLGQEYDLGKR